MADLFKDKADDWDDRPVPTQISEGVFHAIRSAIDFDRSHIVLDFGAGTGLLAGRVAPLVARVHAVDVSQSMLDKLLEKPELHGKVEAHCQDILVSPLGFQSDVIVSAMAAHHVEDTAALMSTLHKHLKPGGRIALADLDAEDGSFHPADIEGVFHNGFDRDAFAALAVGAGFENAAFQTACEVTKDGRRYPVFLFTANKPD